MEFQQEVLDRLARIETKINNGITDKLGDHERRMRFLERGFYVAIGGFGLLQIVLSYLAK